MARLACSPRRNAIEISFSVRFGLRRHDTRYFAVVALVKDSHNELLRMRACEICIALLLGLSASRAYDPDDEKIASVLPPEGMFEAFYPRVMDGIPNGSARPAHAHGSFFKHRNPALVDTKNAAAYGFRFDGKRRFNFD